MEISIVLLVFFATYYFAYKWGKESGLVEGEKNGHFKGYTTGFKDGYEEKEKHVDLGYVKNKEKQDLGKDDIDYLVKK